MFLLPRSIKLSDVVPTSTVYIPAAHSRIKANALTGYALFDYEGGDKAALVYKKGELATAITHTGGHEYNNHDAITRLAAIPQQKGTFAVFGLSDQLVNPMIALASGCIVRSICDNESNPPFQGILDCIKGRQATAALRFFTKNRSGIAFYHNGVPVGFYHNEAKAIESTASPVIHSIVMDGEVTTEVRVHNASHAYGLESFLGETDFDRQQDSTISSGLASAQDIERALVELCLSYMGSVGRPLVEKELVAVGGMAVLMSKEVQHRFVASLTKNAKMILGGGKLNELNNKINGLFLNYTIKE